MELFYYPAPCRERRRAASVAWLAPSLLVVELASSPASLLSSMSLFVRCRQLHCPSQSSSFLPSLLSTLSSITIAVINVVVIVVHRAVAINVVAIIIAVVAVHRAVAIHNENAEFPSSSQSIIVSSSMWFSIITQQLLLSPPSCRQTPLACRCRFAGGQQWWRWPHLPPGVLRHRALLPHDPLHHSEVANVAVAIPSPPLSEQERSQVLTHLSAGPTFRQRAQWHHHSEGDSRTEDVCSNFSFFIECRGRVTTLNSTRWCNVPTSIQ